jgi:serine/threonine protein kinase
VNSKKLNILLQADKDQGDFVDFINKCLEWKPEKRLTPMEAFEHPWI